MSAALTGAAERGAQAQQADRPAQPPRGRRALLIGGTSEIGIAIVEALAEKGPLEAALLGRDRQGMSVAAQRLREKGCARVEQIEGLSASTPDRHDELLSAAFAALGGVDVAILAIGVLPPPEGLPADISEALNALDVNVRGAGSLLMETCSLMREQGGGSVIVLSSAAAVRPRAGSAVYCASKAGIDALALALGDALAPEGVEVMTLRPGFVRTRMTRGLKEAPLACDPQDVAAAALAGLQRGARVVWAPPAMRWAMLVLRLLPAPIFRRLSL